MTDQRVDRITYTRRALDRRQNPPNFIDEELPTQSIHIFSRTKQGTLLDSASGATNMGSLYFSGSYHPEGRGTYSLRITRRSAHIGSLPAAQNAEAEWSLHHSRLGTVDEAPFFSGTQLSNSRRARGDLSYEAYGGPMNPIYSFGPGTLTAYITSRRGTVRVYSSLEGIVT